MESKQIPGFEWDSRNEGHIAEHGVEPEEAEEVFFDAPFHRRGRNGYYYAYGQTDAGRYLFIVYDVILSPMRSFR
jgi:hypothetical protein